MTQFDSPEWEKVMRLQAANAKSPAVLEFRALDDDGAQIEIECRSSDDKMRSAWSTRFVTSKLDLLRAIEELACIVGIEGD